MNRRDFNRTLAAALGATALPAASFAATAREPSIDAARLMRHLEALAQFGKNPQGGVSRVGYSEADRQGREYVVGLMKAARLDVTIDVGGNILGRRAGAQPGAPALAFGSHIDSVPEGGNYDGTVGTLGAIEVAQTLAEGGIATRHPLLVTLWANEEQGLYGSRAVTSGLGEADLARPSRAEGRTIGEGIRFVGGDPDRLETGRLTAREVAAYVELHIEQGGTLEKEKLDIGVVEGIVGIRQWEVTFEGFANHAGTTPMDQRQDALLSAAKFIEMVNRTARTTPGRQVATVGRIQAFPGATNVIPGQVITSLEIRDLDASKIGRLYDAIAAEAATIAEGGATRVSFKPLHENAPAPTAPQIRSAIAEAAEALGFTSKPMPSGAGHDAQAVAQIAPVGMIFIPSVGGISHSPREFSHAKDIANGANLLLRTVLELDRADWA